MLSVKMQDRCISILVISLMLSYLAAGRLQDVCLSRFIFVPLSFFHVKTYIILAVLIHDWPFQ